MAPPTKLSDRELLERALELFWVRGYHGTTVRDLERALEVTAPAIYNRFGNKDALFASVVEHYVASVIEPRVAKYLGASTEPLVDLYRFFRTAQSPRGCLLTNTAVELGPVDSSVRARVAVGFDVMRAGLRAQACRLRDGGVGSASVDVLADALLLDLQGLMVLSRLGVCDAELRARTRAVFASRFPGWVPRP